MFWSARECKRTLLRGFDINWLPKGLPDGISAFRQGNSVGVDVDSVVGSIPLLNGDTLQITPKVKSVNFMRMLIEAEMSDSSALWSSEDFAKFDLADETSLASLVSKPFVKLLKQLISSSLLFSWDRTRTWSDVVAGELQIGPTAIALAQKKATPFLIQKKVRSYNTPENRVLVAAAFLCSQQAILLREEKEFLKSFIERHEFDHLRQEDLTTVAAKLATGWYEGTRGYYSGVLRLAQIILGEQGLSQGVVERIEAQPVLFNSANIFERFIRAHLQRTYNSVGLTVRKGFFPEQYLYADGTTLLAPDIVIYKGDDIRLLADAKYKLAKVTSADHYQLHAYARRANANSAVFFCASSDSSELEVVRRKAHWGLTTYQVSLPLSDMELTVRTLRQLERHVPTFLPY